MKKRFIRLLSAAMTTVLVFSEAGSLPVVWAADYDAEIMTEDAETSEKNCDDETEKQVPDEEDVIEKNDDTDGSVEGNSAEKEDLNEEEEADVETEEENEIENEEVEEAEVEEAVEAAEEDTESEEASDEDGTDNTEDDEKEELKDIEVQYASEGDFTYTTYDVLDHTYATITKYNGSASKVTIPDTIGGYTVTTIGEYAFAGCGSLTEVTIPDSVTVIENRAFNDCTKLTKAEFPTNLEKIGYQAFMNTAIYSVRIPKSLTSSDSYVFSGCANLTTIEFEEGITRICGYLFYDIDSITTVIIPDTVTEIGEFAFAGCGSLTEVTIPDSVTVIEKRAFNDCTKLTKAELPANLEKIDYGAFMNTAIYSVRIPKSLTWSGSSLFSDCGNLTTIEFEEGITRICGHLFYDTDSITTVIIPDTVTVIGEYAFAGCGSLTEVTIPNSVTEIESRAFTDCIKLSMINIKSKDTFIGYGVFDNCPELSIYCLKYSKAAIYAIDNSIPFVEDGTSENDRTVLKNRNTWYYVKISDKATASVSYEIADAYKNITNKKIKIRIPSNITLTESSIKLDGVLCQNYTYNDGVLLVPVSAGKGELSFEFLQKDAEKIYSYALLTYSDGGKSSYEVIDIVGASFDGVTVNADETITSNTFTVNGITSKEKTVSVYLDGTKQGTVKASKAGNYTYTISLAAPVNGRLYEVSVSCENDGKTHEAKTTVEYSDAAPELKEFRLYYNNHGDTSIDLLDDSKKPVVYFAPSVPYTFVADFDNDEKVESVYVTSTRNNVKYSMEAEYDPNSGKYVASGHFDESDNRYVPGDIRVEYQLKHDQTYIDDEIPDYIDRDFKAIASSFSDADVTVIRNEKNVKEYTLDLTDTLEKAGKESTKTIIDYKISMYDDKVDGNLSDFIGMSEDGFELMKYVIPGLDGEKYWTALDYSDMSTWTMIVKDASGGANSWLKFQMSFQGDGDWNWMNEVAPYIGYVAKGASLANTIVKNQKDYEKRAEEIMKSSHIKDKETALRKNKELLKDQNGYAIMSVALALMPAAIGITGPAAIGFSALMGMIGVSSSFFWDLRIADMMGKKISLKWAIDPSGYVYSQVLDNRIENVKVTALYKEKITDTAETVWDASEYDQYNPLYTDAGGNYAWDVPEGFWKVRAEAEGYKTAETEWMEVPPPRTDVAIRMIPNDAPALLGGYVGKEYVLAVFDQYMNPDTVSGIVLNDQSGTTINYTLDYDKTQTDENGKVFAKEYRLKYSGYTVTDQTEITVKLVNTVKSADGVSVSAGTTKCKANIEVMVNPSLSILSGSEGGITYTVRGGTSSISAVSDAAYTASVEAVNTDANGSGTVTIKAGLPGETTIHLYDEVGIERGCVSVKVVRTEEELAPAAPVTGISLSQTELSMSKGGTVELTATVEPVEATGAPLTWGSSNASVVTISGNGMKVILQAVEEGSAEITVTAENGVKASCTVTVIKGVTGVSLSETTLSMKKGDKKELTAAVMPAEATGVSLIWSSSNESAVSVSGNGNKAVINAVDAGNAEITVKTDTGIEAKCSVTVTADETVIVSGNSPMNPVPVIDEATTELHLVKGQKFTLPEAGWTCKDKNILAVSKKNVVTAKNVTATPVKLTKGGRSIDVYITKPVMTSKTVTMPAGSSQKIAFNYDSKNLPVLYYSNAPDIATVADNGEVTAVAKGTATITAFVNGSAYTCKVKVKEDIPAADRTLHITLKTNKTISIKGVKKVTWVSDDEKIVSVTKKNKITANATGETVLRTQYEGKEYRIHVFVEDPTITTKDIRSAGKNKYNVNLKSGDMTKIAYSSIDQSVVFKSSKGEAAYVDADGTLHANRPGKAKLTAKINGKAVRIVVTVN